VRRRRGWDGRFVRTSSYLDEKTRIDARDVRELAGVEPGALRVRLREPLAVTICLRWRAQPRGARGGGGGWALTLDCPRCHDSRRSLYLNRIHGAVDIGCRGCLGLPYRSTSWGRAQRADQRAERARAVLEAPGKWTTTRLRALDAYREATDESTRLWLATLPRWLLAATAAA